MEVKNTQKNNYVFPNFLANAMKKVDMRTQYEASMLSMTFIMVGMVLSVVYLIIYMDLALWFKIVMVVNGFCGILFMSSFLVTTFQQYQNYMEAVKFQEELMKGGSNINGTISKKGR